MGECFYVDSATLHMTWEKSMPMVSFGRSELWSTRPVSDENSEEPGSDADRWLE